MAALLTFFAAGCTSGSEQTNQDSRADTPGNSQPVVDVPQKGAKQANHTRGSKPAVIPDQDPVHTQGVRRPPKNPPSHSSPKPDTKPPAGVFDASEDRILVADKPQECAGTFVDSNKRRLKRVSVLFKVEEEDPSNAAFRLVYDCAYSVITHTSTQSPDLKFSCKDIQKAIATVPICDDRNSIGVKQDLLNRMGQIFKPPTTTISDTLESGCGPQIVPGSTWTVTVGKPFKPPAGFPELTTYHILFVFGTIRFQEFYDADSVDDVTCPTDLKQEVVQNIQERLSSTVISIVNAIRAH